MAHPLENYPGLIELATYLGEVLAMQEGEGWHTFSMSIKASPNGDTVWIDDLSLIENVGRIGPPSTLDPLVALT